MPKCPNLLTRNTWSGFEAAKPASWPSRGLYRLSKFPEPYDVLTSITHTLREISGTYWLIYVSLAVVSRLTRIIRSIDPTVVNFQVNDPDLWNPWKWKSQFNPQPAWHSIYCTISWRSVCSNLHSDIAFSWKFVLFSIHITLLGQDIYIYIYTPCWLCMFCKY